MRFYNRLTIIGNRRNAHVLEKYRNLVVEYFDNIEYIGIGDPPNENETAERVRGEINFLHIRAYAAVLSAGIQPGIMYTSPPIAGSQKSHVDLINNIFNIHSYDMGKREVLDFIDRARGVYEADKIPALVRVFNPFFWFFCAVDFFVSIPFRLLGRIGLDQNKIASSKLGKTIKGILFLIASIPPIIAAIKEAGILDVLHSLIQKFIAT